MNIGDSIGNNKITAEGISGGFGVVYPAYDEMLDRRVAIKVLHAHLLQDESKLRSFRNEARTLAKLNHPNIATLYNLIEQDGHYFMIMEYVDGPTFHQMIRTGGSMAPEVAVPMICQALTGLAHAHSMRVIHRDIKPGNLMVNSDGIVKIMDFGIARHLGAERQTKTAGVQGTVEFMSPEQIRARELDERSDIYSLGVVLYEMLAGRVPFTGSSEFEVLRGHLEVTPPPIRGFEPRVPPGVACCVDVALSKDPAARFANVTEFRQELQATLAGKPAPSRWQASHPVQSRPSGPSRYDLPALHGKTAVIQAIPEKVEEEWAGKKKRKPLFNDDFPDFARKAARFVAVWASVVGLCIAAIVFGPQLWDKFQACCMYDSHARPAVVQNTKGNSAKDTAKKTSKSRVKSHNIASNRGDTTTSHYADPSSIRGDNPEGSTKSPADGADTADTTASNSDSTDSASDASSKDGDGARSGDDSKGVDPPKTVEETKPPTE